MEANKTTHQFKPNSRFEDAVALYNFDIELRDLMFKAVQRLEIALRTTYSTISIWLRTQNRNEECCLSLYVFGSLHFFE